jgi:PKD repeat protein
MGSIVLNGNGQLGMGYSISSTSLYPGIRYTGQSAAAYAAANGTLDVEEGIIQNGTSSQSSYERWGDYSNISIDPNDDNTFWFSTQYGGSRQTKIAAFEFAPPALAAEFSGSPTTVCPGGGVNFTDESTGSPTSWSWTFTGGSPSSSSAQNPVVTYNTPGTYNVSLTVSDGSSNDTETKTGYITVSNLTADFSGSPNNVTVGNTVNFTDNTSCNPTSWNWSFPGGTPSTSTAQNPVVSYNSLGNYAVTLVASNGASNDTETKTGYITVSEVQLNYCASQGSNYSYEWIGQVDFGIFSNSSGAAGYTDFTNLTVDMTAGANVNVTLAPAFSGTTYVEFWKVWIDYNKDGDFTDAGEEVFAPSSSTAAVSGSFTVSASASGTTRMRVSMKWNAAQTSPCETFSYGEVEDYTVSFGSLDPPVADFSASSITVIEGGNVSFTDLSTNDPSSWAWTFAGGSPGSSSSQNPVVTYNTEGTYNVSLTASNAAGNDVETKNGYITVVSLPSCANLASPANGTSGIPRTADLDWDAATDATGYILYFGTNNPPTNIENGTDLGNVTSYNPATLNYNTTYYWRVVPYNANGSASGCSLWSFTTEVEVLPPPTCTTPVSPSSGATDVAVGTILDWNTVANADNYTLSFGTDNPPTNIENGTSLGNIAFYSPSANLQNNTTYYWSVTPSGSGGSASGCAVWYFTTEEATTGPVELLFTDFESGFGPWTDGGGDCYLYTSGTYAAGGNNAADIQDDSGIASSFYLTNGIDVHSAGYIQLDIDFDFYAVSMDNTNEDFWVEYFDGLAWHTIAIYAKTTDFENNVFYSKTVTIFEADYAFPTDMKLRFMCDASANYDDVYIDNIRITASANLAPPDCATLLAPANGATDESIYSNLEWDAVVGAAGYYLFFGTNNPPSNIVNGFNLGDVTSYDPPADLNNNQTYYWKVMPYNSGGNASACSTWSFTTEGFTAIFDELSFSDFESGFGIWTDGGGDCFLYTSGSYASQGSNAAGIQDNSGVASSFFHTNGVDVHTPGYVQIDIEFDFYAYSMDNSSEDFWVQYYDGSTWNTVETYARSIDFDNNVFYSTKVNIFESDYNFPTNMKLRFMCDASGNADDIYIDQLRISAGSQTSPDEFLIAKSAGSKLFLEIPVEESENIKVYPNPAYNMLNVHVGSGEDTQVYVFDMSGKLIYKMQMAEHLVIDLDAFENGLYIINVVTEGENYTQKVVKK